jgi:hypothetical protein
MECVCTPEPMASETLNPPIKFIKKFCYVSEVGDTKFWLETSLCMVMLYIRTDEFILINFIT